MGKKVNYYFVGSTIGEIDQTETFINEGNWKLGWFGREDSPQYKKMLTLYNQISPGDYLVMKSSYIRKNNLPFDNPSNAAVSVMKLKAFGKVIENKHDGHTLVVEWNKDYHEKEWYFYTGRQTIWQLTSSKHELADKLIDFATGDQPQDYDWFLSRPEWSKYLQKPNDKDMDQSIENQLTEEDYEEFKEYLDDFLQVVANSKGNIGKDKNNKEIRNFVVGGTTEGYILPSGLPLGRRFAATGNRLYRYPYVNNQNWTNLYYDWNLEQFSEPTLFVSIPNVDADKFAFKFEEPFNVTYSKTKPNMVKGYQAISTLNQIDYRALLDAMCELTNKRRELEMENAINERTKQLVDCLLDSKNMILRGAPGTGKTYLAQQIAATIVSGGEKENIESLDKDQKKRIAFVQFHPSYDYTDFVEGLRPVKEGDGLGFELQAGIFKAFCEKANEKILNDGEKSLETVWNEFISDVADQTVEVNNYRFKVNSNGNITYFVPGGSSASLTLGNVRYFLEHGKWGSKNYHSTYKTPIFEKYIKTEMAGKAVKEDDRPYIFIIDEINRGEISKIFGELFFSLDPGYRGRKGGVLTQYSNLHEDTEEKFYIPKNVYIIGTMNDIDRSVDTFDFAMRRRFTFLEITAEESAENMKLSVDIKEQMRRLNDAIIEVGLTLDYQIGASYFKGLTRPETNIHHAPLWNNKIYPLLKDYFRGEYKSQENLKKLELAYFGDNEEE